jgi:hypothetical protein
MSKHNTSSNGIERPDWLPDEYDPDERLSERLDVMLEIEGGIEVHARGQNDTIEVIGEPQLADKNSSGTRAYFGNAVDDWSWEVVIPDSDDHSPRLEKVDPHQDAESYHATRRTWLEDIDLRIFGVDVDAYFRSDTGSSGGEGQ